MNDIFVILFFLTLPFIILGAFSGHLNAGMQQQEATGFFISSSGIKPVPKFSEDTIKQAENIVLYDNAPLNTGKRSFVFV